MLRVTAKVMTHDDTDSDAIEMDEQHYEDVDDEYAAGNRDTR